MQIQGTFQELSHSDSEFAHLLAKEESDANQKGELDDDDEVSPATSPMDRLKRQVSVGSTRSSRVYCWLMHFYLNWNFRNSE